MRPSEYKLPFQWNSGPWQQNITFAPNRRMWWSQRHDYSVGMYKVLESLVSQKDARGRYLVSGETTALDLDDKDTNFYLENEHNNIMVTNFSQVPCYLEIYICKPRLDMVFVDDNISMTDVINSGAGETTNATLDYNLIENEAQWLLDLYVGLRSQLSWSFESKADLYGQDDGVCLFPLADGEATEVGNARTLARTSPATSVSSYVTLDLFHCEEFIRKYQVKKKKVIKLAPGEVFTVNQSFGWNKQVYPKNTGQQQYGFKYNYVPSSGEFIVFSAYGVQGFVPKATTAERTIDDTYSGGTSLPSYTSGSMEGLLNVKSVKVITGYSTQDSSKLIAKTYDVSSKGMDAAIAPDTLVVPQTDTTHTTAH